jgi:ferrous iron transport protein B
MSAARVPRVAFIGRQNAGKTSLMMHLTGSLQRPVNFPGSSVERAEATMTTADGPLVLVDLPGLTSLDPLSPDEAVTVRWLEDPATRPDAICAVLDVTRLPLELPLIGALVRLGLPTVIALTRADAAPGGLDAIDTAPLGEALSVPVVALNAHAPRQPAERLALSRLAEALSQAARTPEAPRPSTPPEGRAGLVRLAAATLGGGDTREEAPTPSRSDRIDRVVLHPILGLPIFALLVFAIFQLLFHAADPLMTLIEDGQGALGDAVSGLFDTARPGPFESFLVDGLIGGLGAALIFLPQIAILILIVSLLEGSGYMARAAALLDRPLSKIGLSGRSFVPLASSFACAVPGILATRTIAHERERIATILVAPFMSCSARLPVYVLLLGAFFAPWTAGLVLLGLYALGIVMAALVALTVRRTALRGPRAPLLLELPRYQLPPMSLVLRQVASASTAFLALAGTIILAASVIVWVLSYYPRPAALEAEFAARHAAVSALPEADRAAAEEDLVADEKAAFLEASALATVGRAVAPVFEPAGFDWRITVGILAAFPARELIVPTLGILYRVPDVDPGAYDTDELETAASNDDGLRARLKEARHPDGTPVLTPVVALALMVFFALCSQCVATLGAIRRETRSWRWPVFTFTVMTALAWLAAVLVFQIGTALA